MVLSSKYLIRKIFDQYAILPVGQAIVDSYSVIKINEAGYTILGHLLSDISYEELLTAVYKDFEATEDEYDSVKKFVSDFIEPLQRNSIILEHND